MDTEKNQVANRAEFLTRGIGRESGLFLGYKHVGVKKSGRKSVFTTQNVGISE